jgi:hypothetical protein
MKLIIDVDTHGIDRFKRDTLAQMRGQMHAARRIMLNNMAYGVRDIACHTIIPKRMVVRNPGFLKRNFIIIKATRALEVARITQRKDVPRWSGLRAEEFGGTLLRQSAGLAARKGGEKNKILNRARLRGNILQADEGGVSGDYNHRVHIFLEHAAAYAPGTNFIIPEPYGEFSRKLKPGMYMFGKFQRNKKKRYQIQSHRKSRNRKLITLRLFDRGHKRVGKIPWMKPSINWYLRHHDSKMEWSRAMRQAYKRR